MKYFRGLFYIQCFVLGFLFLQIESTYSSDCFAPKKSEDIINTYENNLILHFIEIRCSRKIKTSLFCDSSDNKVANVINTTSNQMTSSNGEIYNVTINVRVKRLGGANIICSLDGKMINKTVNLIVERKITVQEIAFRVMILTFVIIITFVMGCSIDMTIVWQYMKKPIAPTIGLISQYFLMPLLAFGISKVVNMSNEFAFGLLTVGCCPGGTGSNIWTVLLRGDLNLSMTMTFVSTIIALAMMPFWMFCLGRFFLDYKLISIPYLYILFNLIQVVLPAILGVFFRWKWESKALKIIKLTKFLALGFIIFLLTFGIYANFYMYLLIFDYPYLIPIAAMLPWLGFLFGFLSGMICRQGITRSLTISIEVGIQNIGIAILILKFSMPKPLGDMAAIIPIIVALVTPFPLIFAYIGDLIIRKCRTSKKENKNNHSLSDLSAPPPVYRPVKSNIVQKQSVIEPTLYYSEEMSSYFDESSPSLG